MTLSKPCIECSKLMDKKTKSDLCFICKRRFLFSIGSELSLKIRVNLING